MKRMNLSKLFLILLSFNLVSCFLIEEKDVFAPIVNYEKDYNIKIDHIRNLKINYIPDLIWNEGDVKVIQYEGHLGKSRIPECTLLIFLDSEGSIVHSEERKLVKSRKFKEKSCLLLWQRAF